MEVDIQRFIRPSPQGSLHTSIILVCSPGGVNGAGSVDEVEGDAERCIVRVEIGELSLQLSGSDVVGLAWGRCRWGGDDMEIGGNCDYGTTSGERRGDTGLEDGGIVELVVSGMVLIIGQQIEEGKWRYLGSLT